jgi:hypothetical protein
VLTEFHEYVLKIPIKQGTVLIDFFSGNIVLLEGMQLKDEKVVSKLNKMGFFKNSEEKLALLKNRWEKGFLDNTVFSYVLDAPQDVIPDIINQINHEVISRSIHKLNLELVLYDNLPFTLIDHLEKWEKTKCNLTLRFHNDEFFACRHHFQSINSFIAQSLNRGASVNLHITIREPEDFIKCILNMRKLVNEFNLPIIAEIQLQQGDRAERLLPFADVYFKNQLHVLIHYVFVIPGGLTLTDILFNCTHKIDLPFYRELFETIFHHNLNRFIKVHGGSVLRSIQPFMDNNMFFPPMLIRCRSGSLVYFKDASVICCAKQKQTECSLYVQNEDITGYIGRELSSYRDSHLLFCGVNKNNFSTYGGACPLQPSEIQGQNVEALLASFFHHYFTYKGGKYY